jgi:predicted Fe-S protein YdhL (DUF1289 family)
MKDGATQFLDALLHCGTTPEGVAGALGYRLIVDADAPRAFLLTHVHPKSIWVHECGVATRANAWAGCVRALEVRVEWQLTAQERGEILTQLLALRPKAAAGYVTKTGT